jgi:hypothetical protein
VTGADIMGGQGGAGGNPLVFLIPIVIVVAVVLFRSRAPRRLRPELLWITPVIYGLLGVVYLAFLFRPDNLVQIAGLVVAILAGAGFGWWRGKLTRIEVHPETHDVSAQMSAIGVVIIILVLGGRQALRYLAPPEQANVINAALIAFAVCMVVAARVEMWLRATKLLAAAKAGKPLLSQSA